MLEWRRRMFRLKIREAIKENNSTSRKKRVLMKYLDQIRTQFSTIKKVHLIVVYMILKALIALKNPPIPKARKIRALNNLINYD